MGLEDYFIAEIELPVEALLEMNVRAFGLVAEGVERCRRNLENLPPIKVAQINDEYHILDGHHRLAAHINKDQSKHKPLIVARVYLLESVSEAIRYATGLNAKNDQAEPLTVEDLKQAVWLDFVHSPELRDMTIEELLNTVRAKYNNVGGITVNFIKKGIRGTYRNIESVGAAPAEYNFHDTREFQPDYRKNRKGTAPTLNVSDAEMVSYYENWIDGIVTELKSSPAFVSKRLFKALYDSDLTMRAAISEEWAKIQGSTTFRDEVESSMERKIESKSDELIFKQVLVNLGYEEGEENIIWRDVTEFNYGVVGESYFEFDEDTGEILS